MTGCTYGKRRARRGVAVHAHYYRSVSAQSLDALLTNLVIYILYVVSLSLSLPFVVVVVVVISPSAALPLPPCSLQDERRRHRHTTVAPPVLPLSLWRSGAGMRLDAAAAVDMQVRCSGDHARDGAGADEGGAAMRRYTSAHAQRWWSTSQARGDRIVVSSSLHGHCQRGMPHSSSDAQSIYRTGSSRWASSL